MLTNLKKTELLLLASELGLDVDRKLRKVGVKEAIEAADFDSEEIGEAWEEIVKKKAEAEKQAQIAAAEREARQKDRELELKRLEVEELRLRSNVAAEPRQDPTLGTEFKMTKLLQPFKVGDDIGLYLVNFERVCEKQKFSKQTWSQKLLTLLPGEAAQVVARLSAGDADDYQVVKANLLRKYRLSVEEFRKRFKQERKKGGQSYVDFAYALKANFEEWIKGSKVPEDYDKLVEFICLDQFYETLSGEVRVWVQDRPNVDSTRKAAELADDYVARRGEKEAREKTQYPKKAFTNYKFRKGKESEPENGKQTEPDDATSEKQQVRGIPSEKVKEAPQEKERQRAFEARAPVVCHKCKQEGHFARGCAKTASVFRCVADEVQNDQLLKPYTKILLVNGAECNVLRDSAATMDVVHPKYVKDADYLSECAWVRQVAEENSVCLPMARVILEGPFGVLETEAAVSKNLPEAYPYLFSNKSEALLVDRGCKFSDANIMVLTRAKARNLADKLTYAAEKKDDSSDSLNKGENCEGERHIEAEDEPLLVQPDTAAFGKLLEVDRATLIREQERDESLNGIGCDGGEGIAAKNITFYKKDGVLYRTYQDRKGKKYQQIVVPVPYRASILEVCHDNSWAGHLGINKTKQRLLQEFYWPNCFRDVERLVKSCNTCQRTGKPNEKWKAPLVKVPIVMEPFARIVIDLVGPLPKTKSGYKHILTILCPATKFPEAVPLREATSSEVVDALLAVFSRLGFPAEVQCDQGSVFTSALTTTFLSKCGIKLRHSSVYHPQSNSVERWHSVLKRVLRALCYEQKTEWDLCLPAALFALRTAPHEATGFAPAELMYGRNLRSPIRMIRELWEDQGEDRTVVEYVLTLLNRMSATQEVVKASMEEAQERAKRYYDRNARLRRFHVGDKVMILRSCRQNRLQVQWEGPVEVVQVLSDTNYVVKMSGRKKDIRVYHSNLMKPYRQRQAIACMALGSPDEADRDLPPSLCEVNRTSVDEVVRVAVDTSRVCEEQLGEIRNLLCEFQDVFSDKPGRTSLVTHDIEVISDDTVRCKPYRLSESDKVVLKKEVDKMVELGIVEEGTSDYTSPIILVKVPGKDPRPCVDYRKLNAVTKSLVYPIPNIEERVETVSRAKYISAFDLIRGYWQVPLTKRASRYAAFVTPFGTYLPKAMSFGLKNAPFCFSQLMDRVLRGLDAFALPYLDDVAVFSASWEEHLGHLRTVLQRFREAGLTVKAQKCQLARGSINYLGHVIGQGERRPAEAKVVAVREFPQPRTKKDIRSFLGLTGYYQKYIRRYSEMTSPLTDALRKNAPERIVWDQAKENAFRGLKYMLTTEPVLRAPDFHREFIVQCDASDRGLGVVLSQKNDKGEEHPILYLSRKLSPREEAYSATEKECLCIVWAVQKLYCYISGSKFTIETDHCPLTWLRQMSPKNGRLLRWSLSLQEHHFEVRYKKGKENGNADTLSRIG